MRRGIGDESFIPFFAVGDYSDPDGVVISFADLLDGIH